jgi:hypothetical protein
MQIDTLRAAFTYLTALVVIVGGGLMLFASRLDPAESNSQNLSLVLAGFIGAAIQFVFNKETATASGRQSERAFAQGSNNGQQP